MLQTTVYRSIWESQAMETCTLGEGGNLPNLLAFSQDCRHLTLSIDMVETLSRTLFFWLQA